MSKYKLPDTLLKKAKMTSRWGYSVLHFRLCQLRCNDRLHYQQNDRIRAYHYDNRNSFVHSGIYYSLVRAST